MGTYISHQVKIEIQKWKKSLKIGAHFFFHKNIVCRNNVYIIYRDNVYAQTCQNLRIPQE